MSNEELSPKELSPLFELRNLILGRWREDKKIFLGQVLTIIDASISDKQQRKAIKDLIQDKFYDNNIADKLFREILLEYAQKYNKRQAPESLEEEEAFKGNMMHPTSSADPEKPQWFKSRTLVSGETPGRHD